MTETDVSMEIWTLLYGSNNLSPGYFLSIIPRSLYLPFYIEQASELAHLTEAHSWWIEEADLWNKLIKILYGWLYS